MAVEEPAAEIHVPDRPAIKADFLRDYKFAAPLADVGPKGQPDVDASVAADALLPTYGNAIKIAQGTALVTSRGSQLLRHGKARGLTGLLPATGASGHVVVTTSVGGATIYAGDEVKDSTRGLRYVCQATGLYLDNTAVPVIGVSVGFGTNVPAGTILEWTSPRPACAPRCVVFKQSDGSGLSGGHEIESEAEFIARIIAAQANPPAAGNDAQVQTEVEGTSGIAVQKAFTYAAIPGPSTTTVVFTMRPASLGDSRVPNNTHRGQVEGNLRTVFPADWGVFVAAILESPVNLVLSVTWSVNTPGWVDVAPWPASPTAVVTAVTSAYSFTIASDGLIDPPAVGQTVGLYDSRNHRFARKRIVAVATNIVGHEWQLDFSTTLGASDTFLPVAGDLVSPWSDSLDLLVDPILTEFGKLGPGEQVATLPDPGRRQRRQPTSPTTWPSVLTERTLIALLAQPAVEEVQFVLPSLPFATPVGIAGVASYLLTLGKLAIIRPSEGF